MRHRSVFSSICVIRGQIKVNSFVYIDEIKYRDQLLRYCEHGQTLKNESRHTTEN